MSAKARTSERKSTRASQPLRKPAASGKRHEPRLHGPIDPSKGTDPASMRNDQPPALKVSMRGRTGVQVDLMTQPAGVCLLDTEEKLLKALEDLLPLVDKHKDFEDNNRWSESTPVAEVFQTFYIKLLKLVNAEYAQISLKGNTYRLVVKQAIMFDHIVQVMPVYFIPELEKYNKELFDLCFYLVVLLHHQAGVRMWEDDNDAFIFENIEQTLADYRAHSKDSKYKKEIAELEKAYFLYNNVGPATKFHDRLYKARGSKRIWLSSFAAFKPRTRLEKDLYEWLAKGKEIIEANDFIQKYISSPEVDWEQYNEMPQLPDECCKILWRVDDWFFGEFESMADSHQLNVGGLPFYLDRIVESLADLRKDVDGCFPAKVLKFMTASCKLEKKYRNVFADQEKLKLAFQVKPKRLIDYL